jgi:choice-of-anchor C domain-containing protein
MRGGEFKFLVGCLLGGAASLVAAPAATAGNLLVNGSFEATPAYYSFDLKAGSSGLTGWTITTGGVDCMNRYTSHDGVGVMSVDLDGYYDVGGIAQTVSVQAGQSYLLSFWLSANPDNTPDSSPIKTMSVSWGGATVGTYTSDVTGKTIDAMGWTHYEVPLTATSDSMTLAFTSQDAAGAAFGPMLDDVSLVAVPEPAVTTLLALAGAGCLVRRKAGRP